ncbi:MAG: LysR family transcriptional regulator [Steroidobacteraceae bacterium]
MRFDLVDLQLFLHVAEAASITRGADMSNMALASASERIRKMEELARTALLERGRFDAVCRMVGNGIGIAIIPETAARRCRRSAAIHISNLTDPWALRQLHVCVRHSSELPPPARLLLEHLREYGHAKQ